MVTSPPERASEPRAACGCPAERAHAALHATDQPRGSVRHPLCTSPASRAPRAPRRMCAARRVRRAPRAPRRVCVAARLLGNTLERVARPEHAALREVARL